MSKDFEHLKKYFFAICIFSFNSVSSLALYFFLSLVIWVFFPFDYSKCQTFCLDAELVGLFPLCGCPFTWMVVSFALWKLLASRGPFASCWSARVSWSSPVRKVLSCAHQLTCTLCFFPLSDSGYQVLCGGPRSVWSWVLYVVGDKDLVSFFYTRGQSVWSAVFVKDAVFPLMCISVLFV